MDALEWIAITTINRLHYWGFFEMLGIAAAMYIE